MTRSKRHLPPLAVALLLALQVGGTGGASPLGAAPRTHTGRIVAIGDVHGELDGFRNLLEVAELIDQEGRWSGGAATLVQLGDVLDRGPGVRGVLDLLMRLETEARAQGGDVVVLLGNHEQMNLLTLYRDVSADALEAFTTEDSEAERRRAYEEWARWEEGQENWREEEDDLVAGSAEHRERWMEEHPPGWLEYHAALGPDGPYGEWLRKRPVAAILGGVLFMHAGLSPEYAERSLEEIDRLHRDAFQGFDRVRSHLVDRGLVPAAATYHDLRRTLVGLTEGRASGAAVSPRLLNSLTRDLDGVRWMLEGPSPLWFRGYAQWPDEALRPLIADTFDGLGVTRVVTGHSPQESASIRSRLGNRVLLIDTGMLTAVYDGRGSALEIEGGRLTAIYPDERQVLAEGREAPPPRVFRTVDGDPLPVEREEEILTVLRAGSVVEAKPLAVGVTGASILVLQRGDRRARAVFHDIDVDERGPVRIGGRTTLFFVDSYRSQVAAYQLSQLMGLGRVPPTVERVVHGKKGSAQLWIENATTWGAILEGDAERPDSAHVRRQLYDLRVFDNLIHNTDRNQGNILFDADWNLWWIDNTRSFSLHRDLVAPELVTQCSRELWKSLRSLDENAARERLRPAISIHQVNALLARRDRLVELLEERIARLGEDEVLFDYDDPPEAAVRVTYEDAAEER